MTTGITIPRAVFDLMLRRGITPAAEPADPPVAAPEPIGPILVGEVWLHGAEPWCPECLVTLDHDKTDDAWRCAGCDREHSAREVEDALDEAQGMTPGRVYLSDEVLRAGGMID